MLLQGEVASVVGQSERHSRRVVAALHRAGVIASESSRAPLRLTFPATLAGRWFPGLFPER
jgi:inactivated superfamily I helicase